MNKNLSNPSTLVANALAAFLSQPNVAETLNMRFDLTLKQRRHSDLKTRRPADSPTVRYHEQRSSVLVPELSGMVPLRRWTIATLDDTNTCTVRPKSTTRCRSLDESALLAPYYYITEDETRRLAARLMNRLNKHFYGNRARRKTRPERLTALICQHDLRTRRHIHGLVALPPDVTEQAFEQLLRRALKHEPFAFIAMRIQRIEHVAASVQYNANENKTITGNAIIYIHPQRHTETDDAQENFT